MKNRISLFVLSLVSNIRLFAIDPHGARVDHYDRPGNSDSGVGGIFFFILIIGAILIFRAMADSENKNRNSSSSYNQYESWEQKKKRLKKEDHDFDVGIKWGCGIPLAILIIYLLKCFFHSAC